MTILAKKVFIFSKTKPSVFYARLCAGIFLSRVRRKSNFPIKQERSRHGNPDLSDPVSVPASLSFLSGMLLLLSICPSHPCGCFWIQYSSWNFSCFHSFCCSCWSRLWYPFHLCCPLCFCCKHRCRNSLPYDIPPDILLKFLSPENSLLRLFGCLCFFR